MQGHPGADRPVGGAYSAGNLMGSRGVREALGELTKSARGVRPDPLKRHFFGCGGLDLVFRCPRFQLAA